MQTFITLRSFVMAVWVGFGLTAWSATQYWDTATSAGMQHGDGAWSTTDAKWNVNAGGTNTLSVWTNGNVAVFPASPTAGSSTITLTDSLSVASVTISGGVYRINVSNGGKLLAGSGLSQIGLGSSNNAVTLSGAGTTWEVGTPGAKQGLYIGVNAAGTNNSLTIDAGAVVTNVGAVAVGTNGASGNLLVITNGGQLFSAGGRIGRESGSNRNKATVTGAGSLWNVGGYLGVGHGNLPISNQLVIADGAVVTNVSYVNIAESYTSFSCQPGFNSLVISGGGQLFSGAGAAGQNVIGSRFHSNSVSVVGGPGVTSRWDVGGQTILVNSLVGATNNSFVIDGLGSAGSAVVTNVGMVRLSGDNNAVGGALSVVNGGFLCLTNAIDFSVGNNATFDESVTITNGGKVLVLPVAGKPYALRMAARSRFLLRDEGSLMDAGGQIFNVGNQVSSNLVATIDNGAVLSNAVIQIGTLSSGSTGDNGDTLLVSNGGKIFGVPGTPAYVGMFGASNSLASLSGAATLWNLGAANLVIGYTGSGNQLFIADGATVTNAGTLSLGFNGSSAGVLNRENSVIVTNGGKLFTAGAASYLGYPNGCSNNSMAIVGSSSLWNAGGANVFVGLSGWAGAQTGHVVRIDQGGTVENVGALGVYTNNNVLTLNGGALGVASLLVTNGFPFNVGDGVQTASLKIATGPSSCYKGLTVSSNATLRAGGWLWAGTSGVTAAAGAVFSPGASGPGSLTVGNSLTWNGGGVYDCEITNMNLGPGLGWDLLNVSSQLVLNGSGLVIKMESPGGTPEGFDAGKDYNLRILNFGAQTGYDPANFTVDTSSFTPVGTWTITNTANSLWLIYRGAAAPGAADYTWNAPNSGLWTNGGNWAGLAAPPAGGGATLALAFGDTGLPYAASNNLAGNFHLNQLRFSSASGVTNLVWGNPIALTNAGARLDYLAGNNGSFIVSNAVRIAADTEMGGNALDTTLTMMGTLTSTGALTKRGSWNLTLNNSTTLDGPFLLNSPDGRMFLSQVTLFTGSGNITVSNGLITTPSTTATLLFSNAKHNRRALVKGTGSQWSNNCYFAVASKATNVQMIVDGGYFRASDLQFFASGANDGLFLVTNGGFVFDNGNATSMGNGSTNCRFIITGTNSSMYFNQYLLAAGGTGMSNSVQVTKGGLAWGSNNFGLMAGSTRNSLSVSEGGRVLMDSVSVGFSVRGSNNTALVTGNGSTLINKGSSGAAVSSLGIGTDYGNTMTITDFGVVSNITLQLAASGSYSNTLMVTNSGKLFTYASGDAFIAMGPSNAYANRAIVSGAGSVWNGSGRSLTVCSGTGMLNQLVVEAGGLVTNVANLVVANGANALNNSVTVDGGILQAAALVWSNTQPNSVTLTGAGQMTLGNMVVTNPAQAFAFNGGTLSLKNALVSTGAAFVAGDGAQAASLSLLPGIATNWFVDGLVITNNGVLTGNGLVQGASAVFGRLSPGVTIGTITNNGALTLKPGANTRLELAAYTAPGAGWDYLVVTNGALQLGGTLSVLLTGGFAPTNTQSFLVMTNLDPASVSGSFASGTQAPAYTNLGGKAVGYFHVSVGSQGVALDSFAALRANPGTVIFIR